MCVCSPTPVTGRSINLLCVHITGRNINLLCVYRHLLRATLTNFHSTGRSFVDLHSAILSFIISAFILRGDLLKAIVDFVDFVDLHSAMLPL